MLFLIDNLILLFFFDQFLYLGGSSLNARLDRSKNICPLNHPFQPMSYLNSLMNFHILGVICLVFSVHMSASAQDPAPRYLVDDGDPPMSAVIGYATIGSDSAIVVDNTHGIFLFVSDRREKTIGQKGRGACEHQRVKSFSVDGDTIFVLDHQLGRIIGYSIHSGDCVSEIGMPELSDFAQIGRFDNQFYLAKTEYNSASASDDDLFYTLDQDNQLQPLGLTVGDLSADLLLVPIRTRRQISNIKSKGDQLYFILPFSHRVWQYDPKTNSFSSFTLQNESPDISRYATSTDLENLAKLMPQLERELDLFLLENEVVVMSNFESNFILRRYGYNGEFLSEERELGYIDFEEDGRLYSLESTESESEVYQIKSVDLPDR